MTGANHAGGAATGSYWSTYNGDYGFEAVMVAARHRLITRIMKEQAPQSIVEIGCGMELVFDRIAEAELPFCSWLIVEPEPRFLELARARAVEDSRLCLACCRVEDPDWKGQLERPVDLVLISSLLHEVSDPQAVLSAVRSICGPKTTLHVNVPNSGSLHRHLAVAMGIAKNNNDLGARNRDLGQHRVYSANELRREIEQAGFSITLDGGYFLKPFTHAQMMAIVSDLGPEGLLGLDKLGQNLAELAAEIYVNACLSP